MERVREGDGWGGYWLERERERERGRERERERERERGTHTGDRF